MLTLDKLKELADAFKQEHPIRWDRYGATLIARYTGVVVAKERPRMSKGRTYTPPRTRKCETAIRKWAENEGITPVVYPVKVDITIYEPALHSDPRTIMHSISGFTYHTKGDIDNYGKTVLDALNGIAYRDDKQIADLRIRRRYAREPGFRINITRCGLTRSEYANFRKLAK